MYVKITNGAVDQYPYTVGDLRRDNPNTSFPKRISEATLAEWGVFPVTVQEVSGIDARTQYAEMSSEPVLENNVWTLHPIIHNKSQEQIDEYDNLVSNTVRGKRNSLLSDTDWWALPDSPTMTAEQTAYRQALRDITTHANWPHLSEGDWPTKP